MRREQILFNPHSTIKVDFFADALRTGVLTQLQCDKRQEIFQLFINFMQDFDQVEANCLWRIQAHYDMPEIYS